MDGVLRIDLAEPTPADHPSGLLGHGHAGTLRGFFAGPENALVPVAVDAILQGDSSLCPVVLHGPSGVGKTHLALGLARRYAAIQPLADVHYLFASDLTYDPPQAYDEAGLLVLEDIDQLRDKPPAQQQVIDLLDSVGQRGGLAVVTCRTAPVQFTQFMPRLRSRLNSGLVVAMVIPEEETRRALLPELADSLDVDLPEEAAGLLAACPLSAPQLRGILLSLAYAQPGRQRRPIDADAVRKYLPQHPESPRLGLRTVATKTARHFGVKLADLKSPSRHRRFAVARAVAMYLARTFTGKSLEQIGRYFGGRDHTTVLYNCRRTEALMDSDPATGRAVATLKAVLTQTRDTTKKSRGKGVPVLSASYA